MGVSCAGCTRAISKKYPGVTCAKCSRSFHTLCENLSEDLLKTLELDSVAWFCGQCRSKKQTSSLVIDNLNATSDVQGSETVSMSQLKTLFNEFKTELLTEVDKKFNLLLESVQFCSNKVSDFEKELKLTHDKLKIVDVIKKENEDLKLKVRELNNKLNDFEQYSKLNNLIITNYPEDPNENVVEIVKGICNHVGAEIKDGDIDAAHRMPSSSNDKPKNIIVRFTSRYRKEEVHMAYKRKRNRATMKIDIPGTNNKSIIYINEHLTKENNAIFRHARLSLREKGYKYIWTKNGQILAKKDDGSRIKVIKEQSDVDRLA